MGHVAREKQKLLNRIKRMRGQIDPKRLFFVSHIFGAETYHGAFQQTGRVLRIKGNVERVGGFAHSPNPRATTHATGTASDHARMPQARRRMWGWVTGRLLPQEQHTGQAE